MIVSKTSNPAYQQHLVRLKQDKMKEVNTAIGDTRLNFITDLPGQEIIYKEKEEEALAYLLATTPDIDDYPFIKEEVGIRGETGYDVATLYLTNAHLWRPIAAKLEGLRSSGIVSIESSTTVSEVNAAYQTFLTDLGVYLNGL